MKNSALVVIDLQNDITKNYKEIIAKGNEAIDWAEQKGLLIVYIQQMMGRKSGAIDEAALGYMRRRRK